MPNASPAVSTVVRRLGSVPTLPAVTFRDVQALAPGAIALALLVFAEGILIARTLADKRKEALDTDGELVALGAANASAGLVSGFTVGASTSRSLTGDASGSQTQLAQWIAAGVLVLFAIGSVGCALAPDIETLIAFRVLQAFGSCAGMVIPRAIVRDLHTGHEATRIMSMLLLVMSVSPILAPL